MNEGSFGVHQIKFMIEASPETSNMRMGVLKMIKFYQASAMAVVFESMQTAR